MTGRGENLNNSNREGNEPRESRKRHEQRPDEKSASRENDQIGDRIEHNDPHDHDDHANHEDHDQMDSYRLMEAVDAALHASEEVAQYTGKPRPYPADLMGSALQPDMLAPFTFHEIEEASKFLLRMGEVSPSKRERKSTI